MPDTTRHPVARRLQPFGTTIFAEMTRLAQEHQAVNLGQGFPDFEGPDWVKEAAARALRDEHNQYAPPGGVPALTQALARRWRSITGQERDAASEITITAGCTEALAAAILGLVNHDEEVVLLEPFYDSYRAAVAMAGATPRFVTLRWPDFRLDEEALRRAFTPRTRAILLNTPHNPTGRVFTCEELHLVADLCIEHDVIAIVDEVYEELIYDDTPFTRLATLPGMAERTLSLSSLGKIFNLTGWKIGWAIGPAPLMAGLRSAHQYLTFSVATPLQHAAAAALDAPGNYFTDLRRTLASRRDRLARTLREVGFETNIPEGGYFVLAHHASWPHADEPDDVAFCKRLIERAGVVAIPPSFFYAESDEGHALVRLAFCKSDAVMEQALSRLSGLTNGG